MKDVFFKDCAELKSGEFSFSSGDIDLEREIDCKV